MIGKPSNPVRREAARKRTSPQLAPRRAAHPSAWICRHRRCARDYERLPQHHETMVRWTMIRITSKRLSKIDLNRKQQV
jgi:hypothetical protein